MGLCFFPIIYLSRGSTISVPLFLFLMKVQLSSLSFYVHYFEVAVFRIIQLTDLIVGGRLASGFAAPECKSRDSWKW